jgi:DNA-binding NtrC family response regulator
LVTTEALLEDSYRVLTATGPSEAFEKLDDDVDILCTDFRMPGMNGLELVRHARQRFPGIEAIIVTGYREYVAESSKRQEESFFLIVKPYAPSDLLQTVEQAARCAAMTRKARALKKGVR